MCPSTPDPSGTSTSKHPPAVSRPMISARRSGWGSAASSASQAPCATQQARAMPADVGNAGLPTTFIKLSVSNPRATSDLRNVRDTPGGTHVRSSNPVGDRLATCRQVRSTCDLPVIGRPRAVNALLPLPAAWSTTRRAKTSSSMLAAVSTLSRARPVLITRLVAPPNTSRATSSDSDSSCAWSLTETDRCVVGAKPGPPPAGHSKRAQQTSVVRGTSQPTQRP